MEDWKMMVATAGFGVFYIAIFLNIRLIDDMIS